MCAFTCTQWLPWNDDKVKWNVARKRIIYLAMLASTVVLRQHMHWLYMQYAEILLSGREKDEFSDRCQSRSLGQIKRCLTAQTTLFSLQKCSGII